MDDSLRDSESLLLEGRRLGQFRSLLLFLLLLLPRLTVGSYWATIVVLRGRRLRCEKCI